MSIPDTQTLLDLISENLYRLIKPALVILVAWIAIRLVRMTAERLRVRLNSEVDDSSRRARLLTLISLGSQILRGTIIVLAGLMVLGTLGVDIGPLVASLGVAGLAVSLGAQTLIKDYFGGLMILIENQYIVGDTITIGPVSGTVERLTLRLTTLRDINGRLHTIPNGDVRIVSNASRGWALAMVDLNLALDTDLEIALQLLEQATQHAAEDPALSSALLEPPKVQGWNKLLDWAVQVRLSARTQPELKGDAEIALRRYALEALQRGGVRLAQPTITPSVGIEPRR